MEPPLGVESQPLKAKPSGPETKHYYSMSVSVQEKPRHDGSVQTEVHTYMTRPPNAPEHVSQLALSVFRSPIFSGTNSVGRAFCPQKNTYQLLPPLSPCGDMCVCKP